MPFCGRCGTALGSNSSFCVECGNRLPFGAISVSDAVSVRTGPRTQNRPFTMEERSRLGFFGTDKKQWAVAIGFVNLLLGGFAFVEPAEDFGADGVQVLGAMTLFLGLIGISLGVASRRSRSLAAKALSAGSVRETQGVVQSSTLKVAEISLGTGSLEVPKTRNRDILGTLSSVGHSANLVFTRPANLSGRAKVILLSVDGQLLPKPMQCTYTGGYTS